MYILIFGQVRALSLFFRSVIIYNLIFDKIWTMGHMMLGYNIFIIKIFEEQPKLRTYQIKCTLSQYSSSKYCINFRLILFNFSNELLALHEPTFLSPT